MDVMVHLGDTITNAYSNQVIKGLETKVIIKFSTQLATQEPLTAFHDIKQTFFLKKKSKMAQSKSYLFQNPQFSLFFCKVKQYWSLGQ